MHRALGIIGSGLGAREFDGIDAAEVLDLVARSFQPHVLDAWNFSSHILDAANRLFPVVIRYIVFEFVDRKSTRLNSSHITISYAVFCLKKKKKIYNIYIY